MAGRGQTAQNGGMALAGMDGCCINDVIKADSIATMARLSTNVYRLRQVNQSPTLRVERQTLCCDA